MHGYPMPARVALSLLLCALLNSPTFGQSSDAGTRAESTTEASQAATVRNEVEELRAMVQELRQENESSREEMKELREQLEKTQVTLERITTVLGSQQPAYSESTPPAAQAQTPSSPLETRLEKVEESQALLTDKVNQQYQTKVEAASKYRMRLSGIVLMNAFQNHGTSDNFDYPDFAIPAEGAPASGFGATLRQSEIGLEVFGPALLGAKTSGSVQFDFAGGFPATPNGVTFGVARMKTATIRFDWENTSVIAGQDSLFISPRSPTSFASLATPSFAYAGNLWGWIPQLRVEHHFVIDENQKLTLQAGILDNLTWELPSDPFYRYATAGEQSGQPAYAARTAWSRDISGRAMTFGAAGYYGRQNWTSGRYVDGWAGMGDWDIPLPKNLSLSGEFYRGRGAGGLGAAIGQTVVYGSSPLYSTAPIRGLDSAGGWTQLKWQITPKLEVNGVIAEDDVFSRDVIGFATDQNNFGTILGRNRGASANVIVRPRSDLILAAELRRLHTYPFYQASSVTNQLNLAVGVLF